MFIVVCVDDDRQFYDLKDRLETRLEAERQNAEDLNLALVCSKQNYRTALNNLESISEAVHAHRRLRLNLPPRTPGVGAEADTGKLEWPSINIGE